MVNYLGTVVSFLLNDYITYITLLLEVLWHHESYIACVYLTRQLSDVYELAKSKDMKHARMGHGHAVEGGCHEEQGNRAGRRRVMSQQERRGTLDAMCWNGQGYEMVPPLIDCVDASKALRERRRALKFFKSINPFFEGIRGKVLFERRK